MGGRESSEFAFFLPKPIFYLKPIFLKKIKTFKLPWRKPGLEKKKRVDLKYNSPLVDPSYVVFKKVELKYKALS